MESSGPERITALVGVPCVLAVMVFGELSTGALLAVGAAGIVICAVGMGRSAGEGAASVGRRSLPWLLWLAAVAVWEVWALVDDRVPTVSDLLDPVLAHPLARGLATAGWLAAGAWLVTRPGRCRT